MPSARAGSRQRGARPASAPARRPHTQDSGLKHTDKALIRSMQDYRSKKLDPFMRKILGSILIDRPDNVVDYMIQLLQSLKGENERPSSRSHMRWTTRNQNLSSENRGNQETIAADEEIRTEGNDCSRSRDEVISGFRKGLRLLWKRGVKLGIDMRQILKDELDTNAPASPVMNFEVGMAVMAGHPPSGWERRYSGKISAINDDGTYAVHFDDGEHKRNV